MRARIDRWALPAAYVAGAALLAAALAHWMWLWQEPLLAWRTAAVVFGLLAGIVRLRLGIVALVVASPILDVATRLGDAPNLYLTEHMMIPLLLCGAVAVCRAPPHARTGTIGVPLAVFTALVIVSAALGLWEYRSLGQSPWTLLVVESERHFKLTYLDVTRGSFGLVHGAFVLVEGALWFALLTTPALGLRSAELRGALVLSVAMVAVAGVAQSLWPVAIPEFFRVVQPDLLRITSTLPDPNTFGAFLVLLGPLAVASAWTSAAGRAAGAALFALLGYCLVQTVSRSAWVGISGALFLAAALVAWRSASLGIEVAASVARLLRRALVAGAVVVAAAILVVSIGGLGSSVSQKGAQSPADMLLFSMDLTRPANELLPARMDHWRAALAIWRDFPLFGAGIGKYTVLKHRYLPDAKMPVFTDAHSYYLKILSELGVAGLAALLAVMVAIARQVRLAWTPQRGVRQARVAAMAIGLLAFALTSLAQDPLILGVMQRSFWALGALLVLEWREALRAGARSPS